MTKTKRGYVKYFEAGPKPLTTRVTDWELAARRYIHDIKKKNREVKDWEKLCDTWESVASKYLGQIRELEHQLKSANEANRVLNSDMNQLRSKLIVAESDLVRERKYSAELRGKYNDLLASGGGNDAQKTLLKLKEMEVQRLLKELDTVKAKSRTWDEGGWVALVNQVETLKKDRERLLWLLKGTAKKHSTCASEFCWACSLTLEAQNAPYPK